uniref:Uncharacterized protein n=1 Tax=Candidatus Kentrum sp. LPFa TaxID=2126335 RepID=A0A450WDB0_9GAMM|nr:MAG: hypothetical protein BECKLPF1236A_GA0070988_101193 [Candidatus Kentron sp. LPFa]VFK30842.1 MAG: hypothetical protein BECKLPF1236C_GA0070990_101212 [Candidatus Kentron sp. LPFa]
MEFIKHPDQSEFSPYQYGSMMGSAEKILRKEILNGIPTSDLSDVIADFESEGAKVSTRQERSDNWTLTAIFEQ